MFTATRRLSLILALCLPSACGAEAPDPVPSPVDGGRDGEVRCPAGFATIGATCVSTADDACGVERRVCPRSAPCSIVAAGTTLTVRCEPI